MNYETFAVQLTGDVERMLSDQFGRISIETVDVSKLQQASYEGVTFRTDDSLIGVTLNLHNEFENYQAGRPYEQIKNQVAETVRKGLADPPQIDIGMLMDYESLRPHLMMQIISTEYNADQLRNVPHKDLQDMSIVYRADMGEARSGGLSVLISNSIMDHLGITAEQLHRDALENAPLLHPLEIVPLRSFLMQTFGTEIPAPSNEPELLIASNDEKFHGASVIAYPNFFEEAARAAGGDFFILPSSIHELLLIRDEGQFTARELEDMVTDINASVVDPSEQLTNNVYRYDTELHLLESGKEFIARTEGERPSLLQDLKDRAAEADPQFPGKASPVREEVSL